MIDQWLRSNLRGETSRHKVDHGDFDPSRACVWICLARIPRQPESSTPSNNILASSKSFAYARYAMAPREAEEIRIQIAEAVQRRDELYGKLKISIEDLNEVERLERELLKAQQDVVAAFDEGRAKL